MKVIADENIPFVAECFSSVADVTTVSGRKITSEILKDADGLLVRSITKVGAELLDGSAVKFVGTATIGTDHIDQDYLAENNIGFASAPGSNANSVAEYITSAMLNLAEKYGFNLNEKSIGIVGVGSVGSKVEKKALALGIKIVLNDPPLQRLSSDEKYRSIEEIFSCDFVTIHTPLTSTGIDKTYHLADDTFFKALKPGTIFINSSRGGVHNTLALKNTIKSGKLKACVLDVWENEPDIDIELLKMVDFASPHIAGYSYDGKVGGMIMIYDALCEHFGIEAKNSIENFLPAPDVEKIEIETDGQDAILDAVNMLYDIKLDDAKIREIITAEPGKRGSLFDGLRKGYHIRREFQNTIVAIDNEKTQDILKGLGFKGV
ncbi:MAG: 4-phosphoerythronate dehydrogenase [Anaerohalosphaeraceae bacterium]|nr:4-phosphoerythronate dehydrogenase [Anaerohalosphaeraceae bacterium]